MGYLEQIWLKILRLIEGGILNKFN